MNQEPKIEKKPKTKNTVQVPDLKPKKDAKGGTCTGGKHYPEPIIEIRK